MLDAGFVDEVRALRARGDLHAGLPSMRAVGYRQAWEALDARPARRAARPTRDAPRRASSPSASSPGCAACRGARVVACDAADAIEHERALARDCCAAAIGARRRLHHGLSRMPLLEVAATRQALRRGAGVRRRRPRRRRRRVRRHRRRVGRRQVDAAQLHRRARHASMPARCASTAPTSRTLAEPAQARVPARTISASCSRPSTCCRI